MSDDNVYRDTDTVLFCDDISSRSSAAVAKGPRNGLQPIIVVINFLRVVVYARGHSNDSKWSK